MKSLITLLLAVFLSAAAIAQAPQLISYQATVYDNQNKLVKNKTLGMRVSILQGSSAGTAVYVETQTPTTNADGQMSIVIGAGTTVSGTMASIDWSTGPYFLKTETDPQGGTNYTITGSQQLLSVPFALYAANSGTPGPQGPQGDPGPQGPTGAGFSNGTAPGEMMFWNGTSWVTVAPPSTEGATLQFFGGTPVWQGGISVGDTMQGGVIAYIFQPGDPGYVAGEFHGIIAAPFDQGADFWGCAGVDVAGADGTAIGTGQQNTTDILADYCGTFAPAATCDVLTLNGYSDWFLPSINELAKLYINRAAIGGFNLIGPYWSSTEISSGNAYSFDFGAGNISSFSKNSFNDFRAVRYF